VAENNTKQILELAYNYSMGRCDMDSTLIGMEKITGLNQQVCKALLLDLIGSKRDGKRRQIKVTDFREKKGMCSWASPHPPTVGSSS